jgi:hypothetical protein
VKQKNRDRQQGGISLLKMRSSIPFVSRFDRLSHESDRLLEGEILDSHVRPGGRRDQAGLLLDYIDHRLAEFQKYA